MFRREHHSAQLSVGHHLKSEYLWCVAKAGVHACNLPAHRGLCHTPQAVTPTADLPVDGARTRAHDQLRTERNQHIREVICPKVMPRYWATMTFLFEEIFLINICKCVGRGNTPSLMCLFRAYPYETLDVFYMNLRHEKISVLMQHLTQWNAKMLFLPCTQWMKAVLAGRGQVWWGFLRFSF